MKKVILVVAAAMFSIAVPALAETYADQAQDIQSDKGAIQKDNTAVQHDNQNLVGNRAAKAADKAKGDWAGQAVDSVKIEANKATRTEKTSEKGLDQGIKNNDEQN